MTIRKLDTQTTEQIAAGEVVENPAALVKELMENSLDAGAQRIRIFLQQGGLKEITVIDDGAGIPSSEVRLALERHATSKITGAADLENIQTLGFRGEALPSIAAVSRLSISTRHQMEESGAQVYFVGGQEQSFQEIGFAVGTKVTVKDLFFNTPARFKFLKSVPAEMTKIRRIVQCLALSRPDVSFALYREGKLLLETSGDGQLLNVIVKIYGRTLAGDLLALNNSAAALTLRGYISNPSFSSRSRNRQLFFVNQRYVHSPLLREALDRSTARLVTAKRYPAAFLYLELPPEAIDVNVHPAKTEIRFQQEEKVQNFLEQSIYAAFTPGVSGISTSKSRIFFRQPNKNAKEQAVQEQMILFSPVVNQHEKFSPGEDKILSGDNSLDVMPANGSNSEKVNDHVDEKNSDLSPKKVHGVVGEQDLAGDKTGAVFRENGALSWPENLTFTGKIFSGVILGQVFATYLILARTDDLLLIDQHAAHERILWEKLELQLQEKEGHRYVQEVIPFTLELPPLAAEEFGAKIEPLRSLGLEIEQFGHNTFIIRSVPFYLKDVFSAEILRDLFEDLTPKAITEKEFLKETLLQLACKAAVKANQVLAPEEIKSLLAGLEECANPFFCPHGRPVLIKLSKRELEERFKRRG